MGINNRQRRAAKAKRRGKPRRGRVTWNGPHGPGCRCGERQDERVARGDGATDAGRIDCDVERLALSLLDTLWDHGWQPAEVVRHAARADARGGRLIATAVAADHSRRDTSMLHPRWTAQLESLALPDVSGPPAGSPSSPPAKVSTGGRPPVPPSAPYVSSVVSVRCPR
jgi:hypothetical protein